MDYIRLGDVATYINGYAFKPEDRCNSGLPIIRIQDLTGNAYDLGYYDGDYPERIEINDGDVLISWSASLGVYVWNRGKALLNQHIFKVTSANGFPKSFYYFQLLDYVDVFKKMAEARKTTMGHITQDHLQQSTIAIPNDVSIAKSFENMVSPIFDRIIKLQEENSQLKKQREELLPLLMNGQVAVNSDLSAR